MKINVYRWADMSEAERRALCRRAEAGLEEVLPAVQRIIDAVRAQGDAAVRGFTREFDGADLERPAAGRERGGDRLRRRLGPGGSPRGDRARRGATCAPSTRARPRRPWPCARSQPGGVRRRALDPARLGRACTCRAAAAASPRWPTCWPCPRVLAGVPRVALATPPDREGRPDPATLFAAGLCGVREIYRVGGVQAVAALACGTQSIPRVDKILGPGSLLRGRGQASPEPPWWTWGFRPAPRNRSCWPTGAPTPAGSPWT